MSPLYRCPSCHSYDTQFLHHSVQVYCFRCQRNYPLRQIHVFFQRNSEPLKGILFGLIGIFVFAWCMLIPIWARGEERVTFTALRDYHHTDGVILETRMVYAAGGRYTASGYTYEVLYTYTVGTTAYRSTVVDFGYRNVQSQEQVERLLKERYPVGKTIRVYYLPEEPTFAALAPHIRDRPVRTIQSVAILVGTMSTLSMFWVIGLWIKMRWESPANG